MTARVALIGCGFFARNHLNAWGDLPGAQVVAVCDSDPAKAEAFAAASGARASTVAGAMLAEGVDIVDVVTTPPSHRALVEAAVRAAPLVICQKPLADTLPDAAAMVAAAEAAGATLLVHENFRWQAPLRRAKSLVDAGAIGTPRHARVEFRHAWDVYAGQPYLRDLARFAIMDVGVHVFDVIRWVLGEAESVSCEVQRRNPAIAGEDAFVALTRHAGGAIGVCDVSFASRYAPEPFPEVWLRVEGDAGTVEVAQGYTLTLHTAEGRTVENVEPEAPAWAARPWHVVQDSVRALQAHALDVLAGRCAAQPSGADNLRTLALVMAAYRAADTGARQAL